MADNSWMLPPKLRYKQRKFGTKEAEMLMMCNHRSQEAELQRRYQRINVALQDFLRKYRHEVWEVRHFLRNIGRIETPNRSGLLPTEKYDEDIFNAKLRAHNLKKKKRQEQQAEDAPYTYDTEDDVMYNRFSDMTDRSLSLTASPLTRNKSTVTFDDQEDNTEPTLPELNQRSQRKGSSGNKKQRKKSDAGSKSNPSAPALRRTPTTLDPIMEDGHPPLRSRTSRRNLNRTVSMVSQGDEEITPLDSSQDISASEREDQKSVHLPTIGTVEITRCEI